MKILKKALVLILVLACVTTAIPLTATAADSTTTDGWTAISTPDEFLAIDDTADGKKGNYYLTNDIDFGGNTYTSLLEGFEGIIEGNGHKLYNFSLAASNTSDTAYVGVIGSVGTNQSTIIRNIKIGSEGEPIAITVNVGGEAFVGCLVANSAAAIPRIMLENVDVYSAVTVSSVSTRLNVGGAVGNTRGMICDNVNVDVTVALGEELSTEIDTRIGGLWACMPGASTGGGQSVIKNSSVNVAVTGNGAAEIFKIGGMIGYALDSVLIRECDVTTSFNGVDGASVGKFIGEKRYKGAVAVKDCGEFNNVSELVGRFTDDTAVPYFYAYDKATGSSSAVEEIGSVADLDKIKNNPTGAYRLTNDIYLGQTNDANEKTYVPTEYTGSVIDVDFAGILDGNGFTIDGFSINNSATANTGFFKTICNSNNADAAVIDVTFGNSQHPVTVTNSFSTNKKTAYVGTLCGTVGTTGPTHGAIISNVVAYTNVSHDAVIATETGGLVGGANTATFDDCTVYGSVTSYSNATARVSTNIGGIAGGCAKNGSLFVDCTSFARVATGEMPTNQRVGGILGYFAGIVDFIGCNNFGDITMGGANASYGSAAGGIVALGSGVTTNRIAMIECINFGNVNAEAGSANSVQGAAAGMVAELRGAVLAIDDCASLGDVNGVAYSFTWGAIHTTDNTPITVNVYNSSESMLTMDTGASVRLSEPTGIRFTAQCDADIVAVLTEAFGTDAVSFGTIIAPAAFVSSEDVFTHAALDKYALDNGLDADTPAYVDIASNGCFKGVQGQIAGSLVGLDNMATVELTGRAYVKCVLGDKTYVFYADNVCVRSIKQVSAAALADVIYLKDGAYYEMVDGAYVAYTKGNEAKYTETVTEANADGYKVLSPYTAADRTSILEKFAK